MKNLNEYQKKQKSEVETIQTSVSIETDQKNFIDENNLNLSEMVRDMIQGFMETSNKEKKK